MNKIQALNKFWNSFSWKAYDETSVPDTVQFPYITYESTNDFFNNEVAVSASLWMKSTSWVTLSAKEKEIADKITRGGIMIHCDEGAFWLMRGTPWAQRMSDSSNDSIRRIVLNLSIQFVD